jgi:RND superfamily putative drug exporter
VTSTTTGTPTAGTKGRKALWVAILVIISWLAIGGFSGQAFSKISTVQENDNASFLPESAESTMAQKTIVKFSAQSADLLPTLLLIVGDVNPATNPEQFARVNTFAQNLATKVLPESGKPLSTYFAPGVPVQPIPAADGKAALINLQLNSATATQNIEEKPLLPILVEYIRAELKKEFEPGAFESFVTGPGGIFADLFDAFGSINTKLLQTTLIVVAVILILVYRSPILWILPLFTAGTALGFATMIVYYLAKNNVIDLNGQTSGILDVLVLGAATDYALLLISRYREELHHHASRYESMKIALRGVVEPILASGSTVIVGLMVLLLSDLSSNRGLGPVGSIGIASAMLATLTLLPALLVVFGRWVFWPKVPRFDDVDEKLSGLWSKVGNFVDRRPKPIWITTAAVLIVFAGLSSTLKSDGLSQTEAFTTRTDSVVGLDKLGEHFPSGEGSPVEIIVNQSDIAPVSDAIKAVTNVASVVPLTELDPVTQKPTSNIKFVDGKALLYATLSVPADSREAKELIPQIRQAAKKASATSLVGGQAAIGYDVDQSSKRDNRVIIPIVLILIAIILGLLLRSIFAAALLLATVILSFLATLGVCALVFEHVFGFAGTDASFPLFAFVFLVALGIDYNIFLMTRVREEAKKIGTRAGVIKGLTVTGGVITSAGIVLAATFGVLGVLPLVFLAEIGFAVAFGVLLDTIVVRSLLVPALVRVIGPKIWWPSKLKD